MNRKYNPFVSLVALLLAAIILVLTCTGCVPAAAAETEAKPMAAKSTPRFIHEHAGWGPMANPLYIITDTVTGVQYLVWETGDGAAMTHLLPGEG